MAKISAYFFDAPGSALDKACNAIFEKHGGRPVGSGTWLIGPGAGERDVEYDVPDAVSTDVVKADLVAAGFRLEPTLA